MLHFNTTFTTRQGGDTTGGGGGEGSGGGGAVGAQPYMYINVYIYIYGWSVDHISPEVA